MSMNLALTAKVTRKGQKQLVHKMDLYQTYTTVTYQALDNPMKALDVYAAWLATWLDGKDLVTHIEAVETFLKTYPQAKWSMV